MSRIMRWVFADAVGFALGRIIARPAMALSKRPALVIDDPTPCERCEELKAELRQADQRWIEAVNENARLRLRLAMESGDE